MSPVACIRRTFTLEIRQLRKKRKSLYIVIAGSSYLCRHFIYFRLADIGALLLLLLLFYGKSKQSAVERWVSFNLNRASEVNNFCFGWCLREPKWWRVGQVWVGRGIYICTSFLRMKLFPNPANRFSRHRTHIQSYFWQFENSIRVLEIIYNCHCHFHGYEPTEERLTCLHMVADARKTS